MTRDPSTRDQLIAILFIAFAVFLAGMFLTTRSRLDDQAEAACRAAGGVRVGGLCRESPE